MISEFSFVFSIIVVCAQFVISCADLMFSGYAYVHFQSVVCHFI